MILQRVVYRVFEREAAGPWAVDRIAWHQMDGEIVLTFSTGRETFISWGMGQKQYSIQQKEHSFFNAGALVEVEMNQHPYWLPFIGREIKLNYVDDDHQVLALCQGKQNIFMSSQSDDGMFYGDCVRISQASPL